MRALAGALLVLLGCSPVEELPPTAGQARGGVVRIATWNVHDLFDAEDRLAEPGHLDPVPSPAEVEAKLARVAAVLARLDADVVLLQEVENLPLLERLAELAGYPAARLVEAADPRGIDIAALSRLPVAAYVSHQGERDGAGRPIWPRDCTELHVRTGGGRRLVLVNSHLSSALSDDGTRRAIQAARMREIADALAGAPDGPLVLVGGDLNDEADAASLFPLLGDGRWHAPAAGLPAGERWTWSSGARRAALDHLALERARSHAVLHVQIAGGADVAAASDHRPVVLDLWP